MPGIKAILRSRITIALLVLVAVLGIFRLMLPHLVLNYLNRSLNQMEDYSGNIKDVDIHLWRGAYDIIELKLEKTGGQVPVPFIEVSRTELSIQWSEIIHGSLVGDITFHEPELNFVKGPTRETTQTTITPSWIEITKELFPFSINQLDIEDGTVHYRDFHSDPNIDIYLDKVYLTATNLTNSRSVSQSKFSRIEMNNRPGNNDPELRVVVLLDTFAEKPAFDMRFSLNNLNLVRMNEFFKAYGNFDVESGTFTLFSEMSASNGAYKGYVKPLFKDLEVVDWKKDDQSLLRLTWEAIVGATAQILKSERTGRVATQIPIEGDFKDQNIDYWSAIGNLLRNAFIQAIRPTFEGITLDNGSS